MAPEWEMGMAVDLGMEMAMAASFSSTGSAAVASPNNAGIAAAWAAADGPAAYVNYGSLPPADDFLDFSSLDLFGNSAAAADAHFYSAAAKEPPAADAAGDFQSQNNSFDLYIPQCEDAAELEWLSQFVDDSFSGAPPYESGASAIVPSSDGNLQSDPPATGRGARSKRSRMSAGTVAPAAWSSLAAPQQPPTLNSPSSSSSSSSSEFPSSNTKGAAAAAVAVAAAGDKGWKGGDRGAGAEGGVRRCTHCASEKTPQWRTGPLGPKTLCNACGVRYKSGRLVPEYRPAASPTFVLTQHSNSHRKVIELRRQKELLVRRRQQDADSAAAARSELLYNDFGVC